MSLNHSPVYNFLFRKCISVSAAYSDTHFRLILIMEANTMTSSQTAPKVSILFAKNASEMYMYKHIKEQMASAVNGGKMVN